MKLVFLIQILFCLNATADQLNLPKQDYSLVDVPAQSCLLEKINPLSLNLGKPRFDWTPISYQSRLRILFATVKMSSPGLEEINVRKNFSGPELFCLLKGQVSTDAILFDSNQTEWEWKNEVHLGNFISDGDDNQLPFDGPGELELYGLIETPGEPDQSLSLTTPFRFFWKGSGP